MKHTKRITAALLLVVLLLLSALPISAASEDSLFYSKESNSGTRHVVCTTMDGTSAASYYTGNYTYDVLSALNATQLYAELNALMTSTHTRESTYSDCRDMAVKTDCEANDGRVNLIYSSYSATRNDYGGNTGTWNREHVWPKSLGNFDTEGPGSDLHHIRPSDAKLNSTRGNDRYGTVSGGKNVFGSSLVGTSTAYGKNGSGYFEPLDNVKGDVARICLYVYVRYGTDPAFTCSSITKVFQSVDTLLAWCEMDPVDTWEMGRNEVVADFQGNRNVFIDYPEYAWLLFGKEVPDGMTSPSMKTTGEVIECQHATTELRNDVNATCTKAGYSGDTYCAICNQLLEKGAALPATGKHAYQKSFNANGDQVETCILCKSVRVNPASGAKEEGPTTLIILVSAATAVVIAVPTALILGTRRDRKAKRKTAGKKK